MNTDASDFAIGAVIYQEKDKFNKLELTISHDLAIDN